MLRLLGLRIWVGALVRKDIIEELATSQAGASIVITVFVVIVAPMTACAVMKKISSQIDHACLAV